MSEQALSHLTVVDLTHYVAGPYCTKLLAGFGAAVIKVERPGTGDPLRSLGPFSRDQADLEASIPFLWLNTGKKSVTLDLKTEVGRDLFAQLVRQADVVVESFSPRVMPGLGLEYASLAATQPGLVMTSISSFGQTGPYRDYRATEIVAYALSGLMNVTGEPDRPPLQCGPLVTQYTAGMHAYMATLMAIVQRGTSGVGQHVDVSIQESAMDNIEVSLVESLQQGKAAKRTGDEHPLVPWQMYPCADGYVAVIGGPVRHWLKAVPMFEEPALLGDEYRHIADRIQRRQEVARLIQPWLTRHKKMDIYHAGQSRRLAFGYVATLGEALASPQHESRGYFETVDHPVAGAHRYPGAPFRPVETPWSMVRAPLLGEHTDQVLGGRLGLSPGELAALRAQRVI